MRESRGMGAVNPSKMPKRRVIKRKDDPNDVAMFAKGGRVKRFERGGLSPDLNASLDSIRMGKGSAGISGQLSAEAKLGSMFDNLPKVLRDAAIKAYVEGDLSLDKSGMKAVPQTAGLKFNMPFKEGGAVPGLYANINAKRKRIAKGSGEKMRKPGSKGAPTANDFIQSAKTAKK